MKSVIEDLFRHKGYADAAMLTCVGDYEAHDDLELRSVFDHMMVANRFWLRSAMNLPFDADAAHESTWHDLISRFRDGHREEMAWLHTASGDDLDRVLKNAWIPGGSCSVGEGLLQVCLHSHGHRAQAAKMLRRAGGEPPVTDYIVWRVDRRDPSWPAS